MAIEGTFRDIPALTGLRAVSVFFVMVCHLDLPWARTEGLATGVMVFFALSGYLITSLLVTEHAATGRVRWRGFYLRRAARLYPALLGLVAGVLAVTALVPRFAFAWDTHRQSATPVLLYYGNVHDAAGGPLLGWFEHTWSLAVEAQFYLLWPALLILVLRGGRSRAAAWVAFAGVVAVSVWRWVSWDSVSDIYHFRSPDYVADQLLWGCLFALLLHGARPARLARRPGAVAGVAGIALVLTASLAFLTAARFYQVGLVLCGAGSTLVIASAVNGHGPVQRLLATRPLVRFGLWSYSLYLWHFPIYEAIDRLWDGPLPVVAAVQVVLSVAVACASYYLVERPVREAVRRRLSTRAPAAATVATSP